MTKIRNPFRRWLNNEPRVVTMASLSRDLGVDPSYISDLMAENNTLMPSLTVAVAIERRTEGAVSTLDIHDFVFQNRKQAAVAA